MTPASAAIPTVAEMLDFMSFRGTCVSPRAGSRQHGILPELASPVESGERSVFPAGHPGGRTIGRLPWVEVDTETVPWIMTRSRQVSPVGPTRP